MPDELAIDCIELCILDAQSQLRGYILDGYPVTRNQVKLMTERALIPVKVVELRCDVKEIMHRSVHDRMTRVSSNMPPALGTGHRGDGSEGGSKKKAIRTAPMPVVLHDSPEVIGLKFREWKKEIGFIREWYKNEHKCLVELDAQQSKWYFQIIYNFFTIKIYLIFATCNYYMYCI